MRRRGLGLQLDADASGRWICRCLECLAHAIRVVTEHRLPHLVEVDGPDTTPAWRAI